MNLQEQLREILGKITHLNDLGDRLTEDDVDNLDSLNKAAVKLQARIEAEALSIKHAETETARIQAEKDKAVKNALDTQAQKFKAEQNRLPFAEAPYVTQYSDTYKYDQLDGPDLSLMMELSANLNVPVQPGAYKALSLRVAEMDTRDAKNEDERKGIAYVKNAFKAETGILPEMEQIEAAIKADAAPMYTGASPMSDWVGTLYARNIWEKVRADNPVIGRLPTDVVPDGYSSKYWPLESTDPTWYKVAEAAATDATLRVPAATVESSASATANKQITIGKMGARVLYSGEATEDSLVRFVPQLNTQMVKSGTDNLEHVIIDGDVETSATKNINDIAGTPAGTETFLLFDGFRKLPLVTNTANSRSASGGFTVEDFKDTAKLLGVAGLSGSDPRQVAYIVDYNVRWAAMDLQELKTKDIFTRGSLENGVLTSIYTYDVINAYNMHFVSAASGYERKANTAGKIDLDTDSNNTTGSILAVRFDQWKLAYKRRMSMEVTRIANADSWEIVSFLRFGLAYRDTEASAVTYNVGV